MRGTKVFYGKHIYQKNKRDRVDSGHKDGFFFYEEEQGQS